MRTLFLGIFIACLISCQKEGKFNLIRQLTFEDVSKEFGLDIVYTEPFKENLPNRFGSVETYKTFLSEKIAENKKLKNRKEYSRPSYSYYNILLCDPTSYLGGVRFYAPSNQIILDSAIEYGLNMPYDVDVDLMLRV